MKWDDIPNPAENGYGVVGAEDTGLSVLILVAKDPFAGVFVPADLEL